MPRITISYRRDDSDVITGRIFDRLSAHYGRETVFRDIDSIPLGVDFRKHVNTVIDGTDVMVAVVGPKWIGPRAGQSRLDNAADPVRVEVDAALRKGVPLIPVLVLRAQMPRADQLPPSLEDFAYRNAARIDAGQDFDTHMGRLIRAIDIVLEEKALSTSGATAATPAGVSSPPAPAPSLTAEDEERRRFADQLQREEEERQRQVEEERLREIAEARRREEEERQLLLAEQARLQEERQRFEAAVRQAAEQRERDEKERLEAAARQAAEQEERQRLEAAARQAAELREREERERLEAAARQTAEQAERQRLEAAAGPSASQPEREETGPQAAQQPQIAPAPVATVPAQSDFKRKAVIVGGLAALAIAVVLVIVVSRPSPAPVPAPTPIPAPIPAPAPTPSPNPQAASMVLVPGQQWSISFTDHDNSPYQGTLTVAQAAGYNSFTGHFDVSYKGDSGNITTVREDALITINDTKITISCSNVTYLKGTGNYTADYFDLTIKSPTEAEGDDVDSKDAHGHATMWRM